jgi:hypothetical protein
MPPPLPWLPLTVELFRVRVLELRIEMPPSLPLTVELFSVTVA